MDRKEFPNIDPRWGGWADPPAPIRPEEFEETFNQDLQLHFNTKDYWIKIF